MSVFLNPQINFKRHYFGIFNNDLMIITTQNFVFPPRNLVVGVVCDWIKESK